MLSNYRKCYSYHGQCYIIIDNVTHLKIFIIYGQYHSIIDNVTQLKCYFIIDKLYHRSMLFIVRYESIHFQTKFFIYKQCYLLIDKYCSDIELY